jgi:hypothetical protein
MARFDPTKLPVKKEDASALLDKVLAAESIIRKAHFDDWRKLLDAYRLGVERSRGDRGLALVSSAVDALKPHIFHNDPSIYARPLHPSDMGEEKQRAKITQSALMYEWEEGGFNNECRKVLDDALILAAGIGRITYQPAGVFVPVEDYDRDLDEDETLEDDPVVQTIIDRLEEMGIPADRPAAHATLLRVSPFNFIFPPGYDEIHRMPWVAVRHLIHIDEIKNDQRFAKTKHLKPDKVKSLDELNEDGPGNVWRKEEAEHVEVYEIWYHAWATRAVRSGGKSRRRRVKEMRILWVCQQTASDNSGPTVLKHALSPLDMEGYPFVDLRFEKVNDQFYGISLVHKMLPVAEKIQRLMDGAVEGLEASMALKTIYKDGIFDKQSKAALASNTPQLVAAKSKNVAADVRNLVMPAFPQEFLGTFNILRNLMNEVGAGDEAMRGGRSSAKSATEVSYRAAMHAGRSESKLRVFEKFVQTVARKTLQVMQQFYDAQRWIRVTGEDIPMAYTRTDIRGEFDVGVHAGSMKPIGPEAERQAYIGFMNALAAAAQALTTAQVPPEAVALFYNKALSLWEQDSPELRDSFAQLFGQAATQAGGVPQQASPEGGEVPPEESIAAGAAVNPATGEPLTVPAGAQEAFSPAAGVPIF